MSIIQVFIFSIAALSTIRLVTGQQDTELIVYPLGSSNTASNQPVPVGSTIVFSCTIPRLAAYPSWASFTYTELRAIVGGFDTLVCMAFASGPCSTSYLDSTFTWRSVSASVSTAVGTKFTMTAAAATDSVGYYCKIVYGFIYGPEQGVTTQLQVFAAASQPTLSFPNSYAGPPTSTEENAVTDIAVTLPVGSTWSRSFVRFGYSYTLKVSRGTYVTLYCSANGYPKPTYQWTLLFGQNVVTASSSKLSGTLSIAETMSLQCVASNTYSSPSLSYNTSQTVSVQIQIGNGAAKTADVGLSSGVASAVIAIIVVLFNSMYINGDVGAVCRTVLLGADDTDCKPSGSAHISKRRERYDGTQPAPNAHGTMNGHFGTIDGCGTSMA